MKRILIILSLLIIAHNTWSQVYKDKSAPVEERVESMLNLMTLDEKLSYIGGVDNFYIRDIARLGLPKIKMSDGPLGVRTYGQCTAYPAGILNAATWDKDLINRLGMQLGRDARSRGVHVLLAPGVNIYRSPLCGRNFEYFGEDPYLAGQMAVAYIQGVQSQNVVATVKHFAANNQEWNRNDVSSDMDERTFQEIYLPAFKAAVTEGKVGAIMDSYNLINGVHATQNSHLNNEILKDNWKFDGVVMSDWSATHNGISAANGGLDLEMPQADYMTPTAMRNAISTGRVTENIINDKVRRILQMIFRYGFYDNNQTDITIPADNGESAGVALESAVSGIVLLKNQDSILPFSNKIKKLVVMGPNADNFNSGGGSSYPNPYHYVSILKGLKDLADKDVEVNYVADPVVNESAGKSVFYAESGSNVKGLTGTYYNTQDLSGDPFYSRIDTVVDFHWDGKSNVPELPEDHFSVRWTGVIRPATTGDFVFTVGADDGVRLWIDDKLIIDNWVDEAYTFKRATIHLDSGKEYNVKLEYYENAGLAEISLGYYSQSELYAQHLKEAAAADVAIVCAGFNSNNEGEGFDRSFTLDPVQDSLITSVAKVNKNTIVVLEAGGNVDMSHWINSVKGIVHAFYPGQEGGTAVAEILYGRVNPSGKLPVSFEKAWEDNPVFPNYYVNSTSNHVKYNEGVFVGYRYYDSRNAEPLFPFGFGLSYTSFEYSNLNVVPDTLNGEIKFHVSFDIKNTGNQSGAEAAQLYIHQANIDIRPYKELKGFSKVYLGKGETKTVSIDLDENAFAYYKKELKKFGVDKSDFDILIGVSSRDIRLKQTIHINKDKVIVTDINSLNGEAKGLSIFPVPANDFLLIDIPHEFEGNSMSVYDLAGNLKQSFFLSGQQYKFDCSHLNNGVYLCKVISDKGVMIRKIIIKH